MKNWLMLLCGVLVAGALLALPSKSTADETCPLGQTVTEYTQGHCCWPGQGWDGNRCVGRPTSCPDGFNPGEDRCVEAFVACPAGKVVMADEETCCWPGQTVTPNGCIGPPASCPKGLTPQGNDCVDASAPGTLKLYANPPAFVKVDGKDHGMTPIVGLRVPAGTHVIEFECGICDGLESRSVVVKPGQELKLTVDFP